jgi:hypothetical protein
MSPKTGGPRYAPAAFQRAAAAIYCGVAVDFFDEFIRPHVRCVYVGSLRLWLRDDLETFLVQKAVASGRIALERKGRGAAVTAPGMAHGGVAP